MLNDDPGLDDNSGVVNIDLVDVVRKIGRNWKTVLITTVLFLGIALFHIRFGPTDYESVSILIQETEGAGSVSFGGNLLSALSGTVTNTGGLAATATGQSPPPLSLYPSIVNSAEFQYNMLNEEVEFLASGEAMTLFEYFTEHAESSFRDQVYSVLWNYTIGLPRTIYRWIRGLIRGIGNLFSGPDNPEENSGGSRVDRGVPDDRLLSYSEEELSVIEAMRLRVTIASDGGGLITVRTRLPDPKAAAEINAILLQQIDDYLTEYRIEKARRNLERVEALYEQARAEFQEASDTLALFLSRNQNPSPQSAAQTTLDHLTSLRDVANQVFTNYAQELLAAQMNVQKQTPVFQELDKPNIPNTPYTGFSNLLIAFSIILGLFTGAFWVLSRDKIKSLVSRLRQSS